MPDCLQLLMWCGRFKYKRHTYLSTRQLEYLMKDPQCNENVDIMTIRNTNCKMKMFRFNLSFMAPVGRNIRLARFLCSLKFQWETRE